MVTQLVVGLGNFTDADTYDSISSNAKDIAGLLLEQGHIFLIHYIFLDQSFPPLDILSRPFS